MSNWVCFNTQRFVRFRFPSVDGDVCRQGYQLPMSSSLQAVLKTVLKFLRHQFSWNLKVLAVPAPVFLNTCHLAGFVTLSAALLEIPVDSYITPCRLVNCYLSDWRLNVLRHNRNIDLSSRAPAEGNLPVSRHNVTPRSLPPSSVTLYELAQSV
jgi:hypothetical protein